MGFGGFASRPPRRGSLRGCVSQPLRPGLVLRVHVVVLYLAERPPVVAVDDLLEGAVVIVERESQVPDLARLDRGFRPLEKAVLQDDVVPILLVERVEEVEIDVVRLKSR